MEEVIDKEKELIDNEREVVEALNSLNERYTVNEALEILAEGEDLLSLSIIEANDEDIIKVFSYTINYINTL